MSEHPLGTPLTGREHFSCNVYASGENCWTECVVPRAYDAIVDYFRLVARHPEYANVSPEADETKEADVELPEPTWDDDEDDRVTGDASKVEGTGVDESALSRAMDAVKVGGAEGEEAESKGDGK